MDKIADQKVVAMPGNSTEPGTATDLMAQPAFPRDRLSARITGDGVRFPSIAEIKKSSDSGFTARIELAAISHLVQARLEKIE